MNCEEEKNLENYCQERPFHCILRIVYYTLLLVSYITYFALGVVGILYSAVVPDRVVSPTSEFPRPIVRDQTLFTSQCVIFTWAAGAIQDFHNNTQHYEVPYFLPKNKPVIIFGNTSFR